MIRPTLTLDSSRSGPSFRSGSPPASAVPLGHAGKVRRTTRGLRGKRWNAADRACRRRIPPARAALVVRGPSATGPRSEDAAALPRATSADPPRRSASHAQQRCRSVALAPLKPVGVLVAASRRRRCAEHVTDHSSSWTGPAAGPEVGAAVLSADCSIGTQQLCPQSSASS